MRIVGGKNRGRPLQAPKGLSTRPTSDRVRESLFNILSHAPWAKIEDAHGMDVYAGTGALGLEALSRGAASMVFVESLPSTLDICRANIDKLEETAKTTLLKTDAAKLPLRPSHILQRTLIFLDPPYDKNLGAAALKSLVGKNWLEEGALCILEMRKQSPETAPDNFELIDSRTWGDTRVDFLKWTGRPTSRS